MEINLIRDGHSYRLADVDFVSKVVCIGFVDYHIGVWPAAIRYVTLTLSDKPFEGSYEGTVYNLHCGRSTVKPGNGWSRSSIFPELARQISIAIWKPFDISHPIQSLKQMWKYWTGLTNTFYWNLTITPTRQ